MLAAAVESGYVPHVAGGGALLTLYLARKCLASVFTAVCFCGGWLVAAGTLYVYFKSPAEQS